MNRWGTLPEAREWMALLSLVCGEGQPQRLAAWCWRCAPGLTARALRFELLCGLGTEPPLCRADALPLVQTILTRALLDTRRATLLPAAVDAIESRLAAGSASGLGSEVATLRRWIERDLAALPLDDDRLEVYDEALGVALQRLAEDLDRLAPAVRRAAALLAPSGPGHFRVVACFDPPVAPRLLEPGLVLRGAIALGTGPVRAGSSTPTAGEDLVPGFERILDEVRALAPVDYRRDGWAIEARLAGLAPSGRPSRSLPRLDAASAALAVFAATHLALAHRHPLPPSVALTGGLEHGAVTPVAAARHKLAIALLGGARLVIAPEGNAAAFRHAAAACGAPVRLAFVPPSLPGSELGGWLERTLGYHYPGLLRYEPARLHAFLARAEHLVQTGGQQDARHEFAFVARATAGESTLLSRNLHAVALAGMGRAASHACRAREAAQLFERAERALEALAAEQGLLPVALPAYLQLANYRAVVSIDLLQHEAAEALLRSDLAGRQELGPLLPRTLRGASLGTLGQALTYRGACDEAREVLQRVIELVEREERDRDRIYLATAWLRGSRLAEARSLLVEVLERQGRQRGRAAEQTRVYGALRLLEAGARAAANGCGDGVPAAEIERAHEALRSGGTQPWQLAVLQRWRAVLAFARGRATLADTLEALERAARRLEDGTGPLHPDRTLAAATRLWGGWLAARENEI
ncbi:MAG: hypothetical protein D6776_03005, partial [Planctomycetota bacterium]